MQTTVVGVEENTQRFEVDDPDLLHEEENNDLGEEYELGELPAEQAEAIEHEY